MTRIRFLSVIRSIRLPPSPAERALSRRAAEPCMRLAVLAHDACDPRHAKTAHCVVRYAKLGWSGDEVVAVVDRSKAGRDAGDFVGDVGKGIPVVASVKDALAFKPDALVIGIAPVG